MKKLLFSLFSLLTLFVTGVAVGCSAGPQAVSIQLPPLASFGIAEHRPALDFERGQLTAFPGYSVSGGMPSVDLKSYDLSGVSLSGKLEDLLCADFDTNTKWPMDLPQGFDPERIMELGKDPGLGVRTLHERGITGQGVGLAIVDLTLLVEHEEYRDQLKHYEEIHNMDTESAVIHGPAVASIAVGKTVGVAPEADLYYIAVSCYEEGDVGMVIDYTPLAACIERVIEMNSLLPAEGRIRVISVSMGWPPEQKGSSAVNAAVKRAEKAGVFVISSMLQRTSGGRMNLAGLGRQAYGDPNDLASFGPGAFWANDFYGGNPILAEQTLLVPMDARCTASPTGSDDYIYYTNGGLSWSVPYVAGLYALACQIRPDISPKGFWSASLATGDTVQIERDGFSRSLGKIVNPVRLMEKLAGK